MGLRFHVTNQFFRTENKVRSGAIFRKGWFTCVRTEFYLEEFKQGAEFFELNTVNIKIKVTTNNHRFRFALLQGTANALD